MPSRQKGKRRRRKRTLKKGGVVWKQIDESSIGKQIQLFIEGATHTDLAPGVNSESIVVYRNSSNPLFEDTRGIYNEVYALLVKTFTRNTDYLKEIKIQLDVYLRSLQHGKPICPSVLWFENSLPPRVFMEYLEGYTPLQEFTQESVMQISVLLIELAYLYGYSHNDLHPGNFMYNRTTGDILIIDFGMSEIIEKDQYRILIQWWNENKYAEIINFLNFEQFPFVIDIQELKKHITVNETKCANQRNAKDQKRVFHIRQAKCLTTMLNSIIDGIPYIFDKRSTQNII